MNTENNNSNRNNSNNSNNHHDDNDEHDNPRKYNSLNFLTLNLKDKNNNNLDNETKKHGSMSRITTGSSNNSPSKSSKKKIKNEWWVGGNDHYKDDFFNYVTPPSTPTKKANKNLILDSDDDDDDEEDEQQKEQEEKVEFGKVIKQHNTSKKNKFNCNDRYGYDEYQRILNRIKENSEIQGLELLKLFETLKTFTHNIDHLSKESLIIYSNLSVELSESTINSITTMKSLINNLELLNSDLFDMTHLHNRILLIKKMVDQLSQLLGGK